MLFNPNPDKGVDNKGEEGDCLTSAPLSIFMVHGSTWFLMVFFYFPRFSMFLLVSKVMQLDESGWKWINVNKSVMKVDENG